MESASSIKDIDAVTRQAAVSIPSKIIDTEVDTALNQATKTVRIKGFREGKAPRDMVEKLHGEKIRWDVVSRLVSTTLEDILKKNELQMVGSPKIDIKTMEPGKDLEYTADFQIYPTPEIKGYTKFEISVPKTTVGTEHVNRVIDQIKESKSTLRKIDGRTAAKKGDVIEILFSVAIDGGEWSAAEPATLGLGEGRLPEDLEKALEGIEIGETREVPGTIPADHQDPNLRGKSAVYKITLNGISEKILPEVDDEFAASLPFNAKSLLELRLEISKKLEQESDREANEAAKAKILDELLKENDFMIPQDLVDDEIRHLLARAGAFDPSKVKASEIPVDKFRENFGEMAARRVRTAVLVDRIAVQEKISPTDEDIKKQIGELAAQYGVSEAEAIKMFSERGALMNLAVDVTRNKVLEFLVGKAKISYTEPTTETAEEAEKSDKKAKKSKKDSSKE